MKTRRFALCLATVFLVAIYINIQRSHTFTLSNDEGTIKTEQMRAIAQIKDAAAVHAKLKPIHDTFIKKNFKLTKGSTSH